MLTFIHPSPPARSVSACGLLLTSFHPYWFHIPRSQDWIFFYFSCSDPFSGVKSLSASHLQPGVKPPHVWVLSLCWMPCPSLLAFIALDFLCSHYQHMVALPHLGIMVLNLSLDPGLPRAWEHTSLLFLPLSSHLCFILVIPLKDPHKNNKKKPKMS